MMTLMEMTGMDEGSAQMYAEMSGGDVEVGPPTLLKLISTRDDPIPQIQCGRKFKPERSHA